MRHFQCPEREDRLLQEARDLSFWLVECPFGAWCVGSFRVRLLRPHLRLALSQVLEVCTASPCPPELTSPPEPQLSRVLRSCPPQSPAPFSTPALESANGTNIPELAPAWACVRSAETHGARRCLQASFLDPSRQGSCAF